MICSLNDWFLFNLDVAKGTALPASDSALVTVDDAAAAATSRKSLDAKLMLHMWILNERVSQNSIVLLS